MASLQLSSSLIKCIGDLGGAMKAAYKDQDDELYEELREIRERLCQMRDDRFTEPEAIIKVDPSAGGEETAKIRVIERNGSTGEDN